MPPTVPDAWDDNYEAVADSGKAPTPAEVPRSSRAERKAQHAAANRALWQSAENPEQTTPYFLQANPPMQSGYTPQVQVLSRKPKDTPKPTSMIARKKPSTTSNGIADGVQQMNIERRPEEDDPDSEEEARMEQERSLKQRQEQARLEREEKVRKYEETRRRIFGDSGAQDGTQSKSGGLPTATSPNGRQRPTVRGGRGGSRNNSRPTSAGQSPARGPPAQNSSQLFDADYTAKPGSQAAQRGSIQTRGDAQIIRQPIGPDASGRGGFALARRGQSNGAT